MKFSTERDTLLKPLQAVQGVVERRHSLPILANVLLTVRGGLLSVLASDMELELMSSIELDAQAEGEVTVPARKLVDICRSLPAGAAVSLSLEEDQVVVRSGRSRFSLSTLPSNEFPQSDPPSDDFRLALPQSDLKRLIELTAFAMAHQDVRYYLNGLLLEIDEKLLRAVATDGHRLALAEVAINGGPSGSTRQIILPRKGVTELQRLLGSDDAVDLVVGSNAIRMTVGNTRFTSKLIDGRFPDYTRVIPDVNSTEKEIRVDREALRQCLARAAILSNDKYRAVRLCLEPGRLRVLANNPEQEAAEDEVEVDYDGDGLEIGFNVTYMIDALSAVPSSEARLCLTDSSSSCL
ncbi:MAG: DNA polymerase III subunit beta, partial [Gammaproteobacteria bacterium]|nr:DNA polymerase III subunit beta [Gammaproteobacteria bacterium]